MTDRVYGGVTSKETLTGDMNFFVVHTTVSMAEGDYGASATNKRNLYKFMETVALGAQPVIVSVTSAAVDLSVSGNRTLYGLGTDYNQAATNVFTIKFAIEHDGALGTSSTAANPAVAGSLASLLDGVAVPAPTAAVPITGPATRTESTFETSSASAKNVAITFYAVL